MPRCVLLVLVMCFAPSVTLARAWRVEKNGTGDYGVIQDALDVATSGDTILVGMGRFDEQHVIGNPPWQQNACGHVTQTRITIKGVEGGGSIIGPGGPWDTSQGHDYGLYISVNFGAATTVIEDLEICGVYIGVNADADTVQMNRCRFSSCSQSILYTSGVAEIRDSRFDSLADGSSTHVLAIGGSRLAIDRCDFEIESPPRTPKSHIHVESTD